MSERYYNENGDLVKIKRKTKEQKYKEKAERHKKHEFKAKKESYKMKDDKDTWGLWM